MMLNTKKTLAEILEQTTTNRELVLYLFERWHDGNDLLDAYWLDENGKKEASTVYGDSTVLEIKTYETHIVIYLMIRNTDIDYDLYMDGELIV